MITEEANAKYDAAIIDAKTGTILHGILQTGGDTGRGLILDCDARYDGAEFMEMAENTLHGKGLVFGTPEYQAELDRIVDDNGAVFDALPQE